VPWSPSSSANNAFQAPDTISPGWTTFRFANKGDDYHYAHFVQLESGETVSELIAAYAEAIRISGPRPKWLTRFGGPGGAAPGDSSAVTQYLEAGTYVLLCMATAPDGRSHIEHGMIQQMRVQSAGTP